MRSIATDSACPVFWLSVYWSWCTLNLVTPRTEKHVDKLTGSRFQQILPSAWWQLQSIVWHFKGCVKTCCERKGIRAKLAARNVEQIRCCQLQPQSGGTCIKLLIAQTLHLPTKLNYISISYSNSRNPRPAQSVSIVTQLVYPLPMCRYGILPLYFIPTVSKEISTWLSKF